MSSLRAKFIRSLSSRYIKKVDPAHADIGKTRKRLDLVGKLSPRARKVSIEETKINGLHAEWYRPEEVRPGKLLLYIHGGAFVLGSCVSHRGLVTKIARAAGVEAVLPEYRLAPEHPYPVGLQDCIGVYRALLEKGHKPEDIIVGGDSAGGGLSVSMMLELRHAGVPLPAALLLLSPFLDLTASGESATTRADQDPWFNVENMSVVANHYCSGEDLKDPLLSPIFANVSGLPPTMIQVGDHEILLSDSTRMADKLREAGVEVDIEVFPEMWHVFQLFAGKMPEGTAAIKKIGSYIKDRLSAEKRLPTKGDGNVEDN